VHIGLPGGKELAARIWIAQVGRVPLLLLDTDVSQNAELGVDVTDRLYGGGAEHRLLQEMLLGIGGVRALRIFARISRSPEPTVFHTNEGHAGFLGVERIRELTGAGVSFDAALEITRSGTVFTTHTPVPAGIDRFPRDLVAQHFGGDTAVEGVPVDRVLALGVENYPGGDPNFFNMAVMGLRLGQRANGVSRLHGEVSRGMFGTPVVRVRRRRGADQLGHQRSARADLGGARVPRAGAGREHRGVRLRRRIDSQLLWDIKRDLRRRLVEEVRRRVRDSWLQRGAASRSSAGPAASWTPTSARSASRAASPRTSG
jgi:starch phosphorylase